MNWQKYNGEYIRIPITDAVEEIIARETRLGNKLKVYIGTDSQVKRGPSTSRQSSSSSESTKADSCSSIKTSEPTS